MSDKCIAKKKKKCSQKVKVAFNMSAGACSHVKAQMGLEDLLLGGLVINLLADTSVKAAYLSTG